MKRLPVAIAALTVLALAGCSTLRVGTDHDPQAVPAMAGWTTYQWLPEPEGDDPVLHNEMLRVRVHGAVNDALAAKGFRRVNDGDPDFRVGWHASVKGKTSVSTVNNYYGYGYASFGTGGGSEYADTYVHEYEEGTLILDIVNAGTEQLVWRGRAQAEVSLSDDVETRERRIRKAVRKMFEDFPPGK